MPAAAVAWLAANGVALLLLAVVLAAWVHCYRRLRYLAIAGAVCAAAAAAGLPLLVPTARVPIGWITVLMEGPTIRNVEQLYGLGVHSGSGFGSLAQWLTGHDVTTLPAVVHVNVCVAAVNTILFFFLARAVLPSWWCSLGFALVYAGNLNTLHAAFSETPAVLWATHFWLGCIAGAVIVDESHVSPRLRWLALLCLSLLVVLAALLRSELLVLGAPAVAVGLVRMLGWEPVMRRVARRGVDALRALVSGRLSILVPVTVGLAALEVVRWPGNELGWLIAGLRPLNLSLLTMPSSLGVFLPVGFVILFVLGMVYALRRWLEFLLLPVSIIILFKIYASAAHSVYFERFRYMTFLAPPALFIALFGFRELAAWAQRWAWPPWWKRVAVLVLLVSCIGWQAAGPKEIYRRRQVLPGVSTPAFLLSWNQQTEVRYLLDLVARFPECLFVARSTQAVWVADGRSGYRWLVFGAPVRSMIEIADAGESLERVAEQAAPGAGCVLFYRSLDCNLLDTDGCQKEIQGRRPLEERVLENLPYNDITEYGAHRAELRLGVYPVVGEPSRRRG